MLNCPEMLRRPCYLPQHCPIAVDQSWVQPNCPLSHQYEAAVLEAWGTRCHLSGLLCQEMKAFSLDPFGSHRCTNDAGAASQHSGTPVCFIMKVHMVLPVLHNQHILVVCVWVGSVPSKDPAFFHFSTTSSPNWISFPKAFHCAGLHTDSKCKVGLAD